MLTRRGVTFGGAAMLAALTSPVRAQTQWPTRPIRMVVPLTAGGGVDLTGRVLAEQLSQTLGEQVVVDNRPGAGGTIAAAQVARSDADGYTLIYQSVSSAVVNALVYKKLNYDPINDFAAVSLWARFPLVVVVPKDLPVNNLKEFIALLKANPGKYSYGSSGVGTSIHVAGELFKSLAGVDIVHVPYRGNSAVTTDLLAGRVALTFDGIAPQLPYIQDGRVKVLAVTTAERSPLLPDVPAMKEVVPGYELPFWTGLYAPAKTPKPIVDKIAEHCGKAAKNPATIERLKALGVETVGSSAADFDAFWRQQIAYYEKIVKEAKIEIAG
ncbi:tripartite tricarboxylate transporter substrate binding protein [Microbacteriaceae bacterium K1510]|nr:tripartite tricarboxylate transporter substrate binding protein [Microbacteriaceae bacterium K1510]